MRLLAAVLGTAVLGSVGLFTLSSPAWAEAPGISGELEQSTTTSPKEKADFADAAVGEIDAAVKTVEKLLDQAQKDKNVEHIECLSRKLTPMKALREVSKDSSNTMRAALASNDAAHADQEFRKVAVALTKTREFLAEAQACVGDTGAQRGDSSASVSESGDSLVDESDVPIDVLSILPPGDFGSPR